MVNGRSTARVVLLALLALSGCGGDSGIVTPADGATNTPGPLTLSIALAAPSVDGLVVTSGKLELHRLSVFGDVAADARTMVAQVTLAFPTDSGDLTFTTAPFGLYSRVRADLDEIQVHGTWRGAPLSIQLEAEGNAVDLRGPTLDYEPADEAHFAVSIATSSWFDPACLDSAIDDNGTLRVDGSHNANCAAALITALQASFTLTAVPASPQ